jgi:hypothetical protein
MSMHGASITLRWISMVFALAAFGSAFGLTAAPAPVAVPEVRQHEATLERLTPQQRLEFGQRLAAWNALPRAEREARRMRYLAWKQLPSDERAQLRALAAQVAAFPPERRQALRTQFDALEEVQRRGWRLGPTLGRDYAALFPLLAYVPASQQQPLLARRPLAQQVGNRVAQHDARHCDHERQLQGPEQDRAIGTLPERALKLHRRPAVVPHAPESDIADRHDEEQADCEH